MEEIQGKYRRLQSNKKLRAKQLKKYDREKSAFFYDANLDYVSGAHIGEQIVDFTKYYHNNQNFLLSMNPSGGRVFSACNLKFFITCEMYRFYNSSDFKYG